MSDDNSSNYVNFQATVDPNANLDPSKQQTQQAPASGYPGYPAQSPPPQGQPYYYAPQPGQAYPPGAYPGQAGAYPPGTYPPGAYPPGQPVAYPPGTYPAGVYPAGTYAQSGGVVVVQGGVQPQPNVVYVTQPAPQDDLNSALIIFIIGWFLCCVWAVGFKYIKSKQANVRALGIASVVMFFLTTIAVIIIIIVEVVLITEVANAVDNLSSDGYNSYSNSGYYSSSTGY